MIAQELMLQGMSTNLVSSSYELASLKKKQQTLLLQ